VLVTLALSALPSQPLVVFAQPTPPPSADEWVYTVRPGDTLWSISGEYLESAEAWPHLQVLNRVATPTRLSPGTRLRIPFALMKRQPTPVRVIAVQGRVEVVRAAASGAEPLESGASLRSGDAVTTGHDGSAGFEFADGSRMVLGANGRVVFDILSAFGSTGMVDTQVRLERGRSRAQVTPRRGRFRIWTPAAATVVRGTEFRTEYQLDDRTARVEVTEGSVDAEAGTGRVPVPEAFGTVTVEGATPAPPVALLPPPEVGREPRRVERLPVTIAVPPVAGATAYFLEVAPDVRFLTLAYQGTSTTGEFRSWDLPDGTYAFRLRAVDARGLQGQDAVSTLILNARPEPPVLIEPAAGAVVSAERPTFNWSRPAGASEYRFQLARREALDAALLDTTHAAAGALVVDRVLEPADYAWRVAARAGADEGPFGDWQAFTRRTPPPAPSPAPPEAEAGRVRLAWPKGGDGTTYRLQIARDVSFSDIVIDRATSTPGTTIESPAPGTYYLRVKSIEADGLEGDFGVPQSFAVAVPAPKRRPWGLLLSLVPVVVFLITQ
jgi:hypothetical protein